VVIGDIGSGVGTSSGAENVSSTVSCLSFLSIATTGGIDWAGVLSVFTGMSRCFSWLALINSNTLEPENSSAVLLLFPISTLDSLTGTGVDAVIAVSCETVREFTGFVAGESFPLVLGLRLSFVGVLTGVESPRDVLGLES
jgi:hypothetical protein